MIPRYRAWHKTWEELGKVKRIRFNEDGDITTVFVVGKTSLLTQIGLVLLSQKRLKTVTSSATYMRTRSFWRIRNEPRNN